MSSFEMVSPESVGIRRKGIEDFLDSAEKNGLELHRFMILRHGKCVAKITWEPYREDDLHPLFSFSKSLTATAIAFARQEGILSLDEKLVDIFPEDIPDDPSENMKECSLHHLLCMSCGHETEINEMGPGWRKAFFRHPFIHKPGTFYLYNTPGTNMLAAVIKKKTGLQVTEYLRSRLFEPLGIGQVECVVLPDDLQTQMGGGGMKMSLEDMAKFSQFMLQDGTWEGKQLLKGWYHNLAGTKQIETEGDSYGHIKDWALGYGYQCWMCNLPGSFRADGAYGQFGLIYPTLDMCIITNSATEQTQIMIDKINECILPNVLDDELVSAETEISVPDAVKAPSEGKKPVYIKKHLPALLNCRNPLFEAVLAESEYKALNGNSMDSICRLVGGAGLRAYGPEAHIEKIKFSFGEDHVTLHLTEDGREKSLNAGLDGSFHDSYIDGVRYAATARWRGLRRLELEVRNMTAISGVRLIMDFSGTRLLLEADETLMSDGGLGMTDRNPAPFIQVADISNISMDITGNNPAVTGNPVIMDDGIKLAAALDMPSDFKGGCPLAIVIHGFTGYKEEPHILGVSETMNKIGIATLRVDMYGHGNSGGQFSDHTLFKWISNILAVIDYVKTLDFVTDIYLCGHSQGGLAVMLAAAMKKHDISALIPLSPACMIPECARKGDFLGNSFDPDNIPDVLSGFDDGDLDGNYIRVAQMIHVEEAIDKYDGPVLIVHGEADESVPCDVGKKAASRYKNATFVGIPGDSHCYDYHLDQVTEAVKEWLLELK